ncbi:trypsin-like peptidase domain-containing protein [Actinomadura sp. WMMA1423]|uniref:nSTAND1 domain-containing NTPase n=1 Tax=Actinomadura sp. WMMA1423 TaxID=2591108 RepID=UPI00114625E8|nr:trypsin-like peptidase domain-containing protein [Actinomadura sp. WMMA1423]
MQELAAALVSVLDEDGEHCGFGLLAAPGKVVTCAHVVAQAVGESSDLVDAPSSTVRLAFPFVRPHAQVMARVAVWVPMDDDENTGDIAGLEIVGEPPAWARHSGMARGGAYDDHEVLAYGYQEADTAQAPTWVPGQIAGEVAGGRLQIGARPSTGGLRIRRGFSGGPVWDRRTGQVIGLVAVAWLGSNMWLAYAVSGDHVYQAWPELREFFDRACPFRALAPFGAADSAVFFGRERATRTALEVITGNEVTIVQGPSGVGKTSLLEAGVVPLLEETGHAVVSLRATPDGGLWAAIAAAVNVPKETLDGDRSPPSGARERMHRLSDSLDGRPVVLVWDQFEQLMREDPAQADRVLAELVDLTMLRRADGRPAARAVLVVREDLLTDLLNAPAFRARRPAEVRVRPLNLGELREAIEGPLRATGYARYEHGLVDRILDDLRGRPYSLPILQIVLDGLWTAKASDGTLRLSDYLRLSRDQQPLTAHLDKVWHATAPDVRARAFELMLHLVVPIDPEARGAGAFVRRRAYLSELTEPQRLAAEALSRSRLVVLRGHGTAATAELAHDAVIDHWPTLAAHLNAHHDFLVRRDALRRRRTAWLYGDKNPAYLPSGAELDQLSLHADGALLSADEREFIAAARRRWRARRRGQGIVATITVTVLAMLTAVIVVVWDERSSTQADSDSVSLANTARQLMATRPDVAKQLAVLAYERSHTPQAIDAVLQGLAAPGVIEAPDEVTALTYSPDGTTLLVGTSSVVRLWNIRQRRFVSSFQAGNTAVTSMAVRSDGRVAAVATSGGGIGLWDLKRPGGPARMVSLPPSPAAATRMLFSPDGNRLYTALDPDEGKADPGVSQVREWDVSRPEAPRLSVSMVPRTGTVPALSQDRAGQTLVIGGTRTLILDVREAQNPQRLSTIATRNGYLSAGGATVIGRDGVWDVRDPRKPHRIGAADSATTTVPASPAVTIAPAACPWDSPESPASTATLPPPSAVTSDGRLLASAHEFRIEIRARTDVNCAGARWGRMGDGFEAGAVLRPDDRALAFADALGRVTLVDLSGSRPRVLSRSQGPGIVGQNFVQAIAVSNDGSLLANVGADNVIKLWRWTDGGITELARLPGRAGRTDALAFGDDGRTLAATGVGLTTLWNLTDPSDPHELAVDDQGNQIAESVALDARDHLLADGSGAQVRVFDIDEPSRPHLVKTLDAHPGNVAALRFDPGRGRLISAGGDHTVKIWDVSKPDASHLLTTLTGHAAPVTALALSADGTRLVSGDDGGVVLLWQIDANGKASQIGRLTAAGAPSVSSVAASRDGHAVVATYTNGSVLIWNTDPDAAVRTICASVASPTKTADWHLLAPTVSHPRPCG